MTEYIVLLEPSDDGSWGAYVPDLPGCTAGGATADAALEGIEISVKLWIEEAQSSGQRIPPPESRATTVRVAV
jgi:predicted RNase H-like HicB family nuclease